ncbi:putative toxin-antitoxin system toxin component, PIN family [Candidatus Pacearchaeota archaeon]|nr:putative toxin-antitoxin system toxin component, PIN family [Candidatus Pacearchaeota archaeon]
MKVVLDTNIFISGIFWSGNFCSIIIDNWKNGRFEMISSLEIIEELVETLSNFKIQMPEEIIEEWKNLIIENSTITYSSEKLEVIKEDPDDNKFLEAAVAGKAEFIISQDKHLLNLKEYRGIRILKPEEFLHMSA